MLTNEFHLLTTLVVVLTGLGAFMLCLAALNLIGAATWRLWLSASPGAARQARFRAALVAYQSSFAKRGRRQR